MRKDATGSERTIYKAEEVLTDFRQNVWSPLSSPFVSTSTGTSGPRSSYTGFRNYPRLPPLKGSRSNGQGGQQSKNASRTPQVTSPVRSTTLERAFSRSSESRDPPSTALSPTHVDRQGQPTRATPFANASSTSASRNLGPTSATSRQTRDHRRGNLIAPARKTSTGVATGQPDNGRTETPAPETSRHRNRNSLQQPVSESALGKGNTGVTARGRQQSALLEKSQRTNALQPLGQREPTHSVSPNGSVASPSLSRRAHPSAGHR